MAQESLIQSDPPIPSATQPNCGSDHPVHKTLASAANLANLLPTGTVLAFQSLINSFSNNGTCQESNQYLTSFLIAFCGLMCYLSSFTDSITLDGKIYHGFATYRGLYILNANDDEKDWSRKDLSKYRIRFIDFVHSSLSLAVFLVFAFSNSEVQNCFFPFGGTNGKEIMMNLPLGAGMLASFLFTIFPTTRRGIGYSDMAPQA